MVTIQYPDPDFRIKKEGGREYIFDALRKKWLLLTPEEWVRQNFVQYLARIRKYPAALIALEKEIRVGELQKRFDVLVYSREHRPWMMIECKSGEVMLDEKVLEQVLRYNSAVPVSYIVITNGNSTAAWEKDHLGLHPISELPRWE
jgi:hypothetical protein